jgi:Flp pilus assembly protein TadG
MLTPFRFLRQLVGDHRASVAITFAFAALPMVMLAGAAVDYARALNARSLLQVALDNAVIQHLQSSSAATNFAANASQSGVTISSTHPLTFTTNSDGSITATVSAAVSTDMLSLIGVTSIPVSLSSTAKMTHPATPHSLTYQFQYAKGWYYKVVTLYVKQTSSSAALPLATWTYKAYNDNLAAIPKDASAVPYFWSDSTNPPTATGIGIVTTSWNDANASTIGATLNKSTNTIVFNKTYYDLYMTMQIANSRCPLGQTVYSTSTTASDSHQAIYNAVYAKKWSGSYLTEDIGCSGTANNTWSRTISTNSASDSNFLYINGVEQKANTAIGLTQAFPCASDATASTPVTNNYEWEDNSNDTSDTRDFFFSLTTTCTLTGWNNAPNIPALVN